MNDDCCSVIYNKLTKRFGDQWLAWEPYTIFSELKIHDNVPLQAKILAVQTLMVSETWTYDYEVLFNFAMAEDGLAAASDAFAYPTPEQLCWTINEIELLKNKKITNDEGFDPDNIDPAVAMLLLNEGFVYTPDELSFCFDVLEKYTLEHKELQDETKKLWNKIKNKSISDLEALVNETAEDDPLTVQISRLVDCLNFVQHKSMLRSKNDGANL